MLNTKTQQLYTYDLSLGAKHIAGVDEAGRGPLAGPVVCASVIMDLYKPIDGIYDSKKLNEKKRESLYSQIIASAVSYHISIIDNNKIDEINILNSTKLGMQQAILSVNIKPDIILVDAIRGLDIGRDYSALIKGDATSYSIAAASILAKVTRDRIMESVDKSFSQYGFARHKGYGTAAHIEAIKQHGLCNIHRRSFCRNFIE